jgi:hypothetical protein
VLPLEMQVIFGLGLLLLPLMMAHFVHVLLRRFSLAMAGLMCCMVYMYLSSEYRRWSYIQNVLLAALLIMDWWYKGIWRG